jgi:hypothetical protein
MTLSATFYTFGEMCTVSERYGGHTVLIVEEPSHSFMPKRL